LERSRRRQEELPKAMIGFLSSSAPFPLRPFECLFDESFKSARTSWTFPFSQFFVLSWWITELQQIFFCAVSLVSSGLFFSNVADIQVVRRFLFNGSGLGVFGRGPVRFVAPAWWVS